MALHKQHGGLNDYIRGRAERFSFMRYSSDKEGGSETRPYCGAGRVWAKSASSVRVGLRTVRT